MRSPLAILGLWLIATLAAGCTHSCRSAKELEAKAPAETEQTSSETVWPRPWFNDQPQHLKPERIHGGIM